MSFLRKLFARSRSAEKTEIDINHKEPDNARLKFYLTNYNKNPTQENYEIALNEITHGNTAFLIPTVDAGNVQGVAEANTTIGFTSSFDLDGLKVLGIFTDEHALVAWTKRPTQYYYIRSADIIQLCKDNNIGRIVIDSDQPTMFVLERNRTNIKEEVIQEATPVKIGYPIQPLPEDIISRLADRFKKVASIAEAYQFLMERNGEQTITIGINLENHTENARYAVQDAMNDALAGIELNHYIDLLVLDESWLASVKSIPNSLFYEKR